MNKNRKQLLPYVAGTRKNSLLNGIFKIKLCAENKHNKRVR